MISLAVTKRLGDFLVKAEFTGAPHGVTALFGPSGGGKTTIINIIAGLVQPDAGYIRINGLCVFDSESGTNLPPEKRKVGYVFQDGRLFPHLSVRSNLLYGMRLLRKEERKLAFPRVVEVLGVSHLLDRRPAGLSGGEKQRVAIGRALLRNPRLLLMDEPLASLDDARKEELLPFIALLPKEFGIPALYVSHSVREIRALADKVARVEGGLCVGVVDASEFSTWVNAAPGLSSHESNPNQR